MTSRPKKGARRKFDLAEFSVESLQQLLAVVTHELRRRKILRVRDRVEALLDTEGLTLWDLLADTQVVSVREGPPRHFTAT